MKKFIFMFLIIVLASVAYAQEFKFIGGTSFSKYTVSPWDIFFNWEVIVNYKSSYKTSFIIGGGIEFALTKNIAFEIDGLYFQKGSITKAQEIPNTQWDHILNVFSFPMLLKIKVLPDSSPYLLGGGEFSIVLSHDYKLNHVGQVREEEDIKESTNSFDYGLVFGGGYEIKMQVVSLFIEGRYHIGLRNIIKESMRWESIKTNAVVLIFGLKI